MTTLTDTNVHSGVTGPGLVDRAHKIVASAAPVALYGSLVIVFAW